MALVVAVGAGCATEADPEAYAELVTDAGEGSADGSAAYLAEAGERSSGEAYRVSMTMSVSMTGGDDEASESYGFEGEAMTGAQDGDAYEMHMDMAGPMSELAEGEAGPPVDLTMDIVGDDETLYIRAPFFAELSALGGEAPLEGWMADVGDLGEKWGRIDLTALDDLAAGDIGTSVAGPGMGDPAAMLDLLGEAADPEDLGTDEIDGIEVRGTRFVVPLSDMMGDEALAGAGASAGTGEGDVLDDEQMEAFVDAFLGDVPVETWVDEDGYVRRVSYEIDMGSALASLGEVSEEDGGEGFSMTMGATIDFSDYGDPGIEIVFPDEADTVDVTDAFRSMAEGD
jgi:hypothetical protein